MFVFSRLKIASRGAFSCLGVKVAWGFVMVQQEEVLPSICFARFEEN